MTPSALKAPAPRQLGEHGPARPYDLATPLDAYVAAQAASTPQALALSDDRERLSYAEMWRRVERWSAVLHAHDVAPGDVVGVCAERSVELPVVLLAILRRGAAYCPLEPDQPAQRLHHLISQACPAAIVTAPAFGDAIGQAAGSAKLIVSGTDTGLGAANTTSGAAATTTLEARADTAFGVPAVTLTATVPDRPQADADDPAYVIFTSGSTGRPKGVVVPHRGVVNRLLWMQETFKLTAEDVVLQKTPYGFDVSVWELFWPLIAGARLHLLEPDGHRDPQLLAECIREQQVTTMHFVPSMLSIFLEEPLAAGCSSLRRVISSGEALPCQQMLAALRTFEPATLWNLYGPTEASIDVTYWQCASQSASAPVPIGRPVANVGCYLLDDEGNRVAQGTIGELCIGGVQVALGYINQPELTAERFVEVPSIDGVLYRTGDLARRRADGLLEYAGRADRQMKFNGIRIEPGEIEAVIRELPEVREVAVVLRQATAASDKLVAYVVLRQETIVVAAIRSWVASRLPAYMVPSFVVLLPELPLSGNGKLDVKALPAPPGRPPSEAACAPR